MSETFTIALVLTAGAVLAAAVVRVLLVARTAAGPRPSRDAVLVGLLLAAGAAGAAVAPLPSFTGGAL